MTTSKNSRLICVRKGILVSRGHAENEPMTIKCAEKYQPITNYWSLGTSECADNYFVEIIFVEITRVW